eukprot:6207756-Pleurochrysis_carterae.AAC.3
MNDAVLRRRVLLLSATHGLAGRRVQYSRELRFRRAFAIALEARLCDCELCANMRVMRVAAASVAEKHAHRGRPYSERI